MMNALNLGLAGIIFEPYCYALCAFKIEETEETKEKASQNQIRLLTYMDMPQHLVAAFLATSILTPPVSATLSSGLPLAFKTVTLVTDRGATINIIAQYGDHLLRLTSKITILAACLYACKPVVLSKASMGAIVRAYIAFSDIKGRRFDLAEYANSTLDSFEGYYFKKMSKDIHEVQKKFGLYVHKKKPDRPPAAS